MSNRIAFKLFCWLVLAFVAQTILLPYMPSATSQQLIFNSLIGGVMAIGALTWRYAPQLD